MLFRPSYCANCGEKIERVEWHPWTSRRFCEICETEFKGQDLLPRVITAAGAIALFVGVGSYLKSGANSPDPSVLRQSKGNLERPAAVTAANSAAIAPTQTNGNVATSQAASIGNFSQQAPRSSAVQPPPKQIAGEKGSIDGPIYYCGAQTKKGTPCTRRVKGNVRCFQHTGMPAMLPPEKLRIS